MKNKTKWIFWVISALILSVAVYFIIVPVIHHHLADAFSGATPQAREQPVPDNISLLIDGQVKQDYHFTSYSFGKLAKSRIRTRETSPAGDILGAYIYTGVPVVYILEGIIPQKPANAAFDRPLDMVVIFTSQSGQTTVFSYGEIITADDSLPITLAFHREPILPTKYPGTYTRNKFSENVTSLRLICPREKYTTRCLDNVVRITLTTLPAPDQLLPGQQKNIQCSSNNITCIDGNRELPVSFENLNRSAVNGWFRTGHGRGIKDEHLPDAAGFPLPGFLKQNFPGCSPGDFFLFVGCDGYRSIFSGYEIFTTTAGESFLLLDSLDGKTPEGGFTIGAIADFFIDRCVWGVSHIVRIPYSPDQPIAL